jgi:membrane carboxypeptidase/penicillin-binding protein PbpC
LSGDSAVSGHDSSHSSETVTLDLSAEGIVDQRIKRAPTGLVAEAAAAGRRTLFFEPEGPGFVRLTVIDGRGATDSVVVRLQ